MPVLLGELGCWCHRWGPQVTYIKSRQLEAPPSQPAYHHPLLEGAVFHFQTVDSKSLWPCLYDLSVLYKVTFPLQR